MSKINSSDLFGGNLLSKFLYFLSFIFLCLAGIALLSKIQTYDPASKEIISSETPWKIAILLFIPSVITGYIAYRLAGGKRNPAIWKDKALYDLLKHAFLIGEARIGFHEFRDQSILLSKMESIGVKNESSESPSQFIRDKIVMDRKVFDICRDDIIIQMIHKGKVWFWDGYGKKRTAQHFHRAEIIFDLKSSSDYIFSEVLEGIKTDDTREEKILLTARRDEPLGSLLSETLKGKGFEVRIVESFEEVLSELANEQYEVVLPTNNSLHYSQIPTIVSEIRDKYPDIGIIVLSGYYNQDYIADLKARGIDVFLKMPFKIEELTSKIRNVISKKRLSKSL